MSTTPRILPGVYLAAGTGRPAIAAATLGHDIRASGPRGAGGLITVRTPAAMGAHAGPAFLPGPRGWVGTTPIDPRAPDLLRAAVLGGGACQTRMAYPVAFGRLGGESPLYDRKDTPAATVDDVVAAYTGPAGAVVVEPTGPGAPASYAPGYVLTPGQHGRSTARAPWWGAPPIAGAPTAAGVDPQPMPTGNPTGTTVVGAPWQADPQYQPNPNDPNEVGGPRVTAGPPPPAAARPRAPRPPGGGMAVLLALAAAWIILKPRPR